MWTPLAIGCALALALALSEAELEELCRMDPIKEGLALRCDRECT